MISASDAGMRGPDEFSTTTAIHEMSTPPPPPIPLPYRPSRLSSPMPLVSYHGTCVGSSINTRTAYIVRVSRSCPVDTILRYRAGHIVVLFLGVGHLNCVQ